MTALLLVVPLIAAAPVPKVKEPVRLDGAWRLTAVTVNGRAAGGNLESVWRFDKDTLTVESPNGGGVGVPRPIRTDPKATPMQFEFGTEGQQLGVYEVKGDTLTIAVGVAPGTRPATATEATAIVYTLARVKGEK